MVRTVAVADPGDLLAHLRGPASYAWVRHGEGMVAWGEAARVTVPPGPGRFAWARDWLAQTLGEADIDDQVRVPGSGPVAFGSFTFDPASPGSVLAVPAAVLARRGGRAWLTTIGRVPATLAPAAPQPATAPTGPVRYGDGSLSAPQWQHAVSLAVERIRRGDLKKVVLARDLDAVAERPIDLRALLSRLTRRYPACYTFSCAGLVGATPELLVRRTGEAVESLVLAGTTARAATPAEDAARGTALLSSGKDRHEHACAVDSVRDALAPLCKDLTVPAAPELLKLSNVQHLASPVSGRLSESASVLDVVAAMHPTAAVGGTPTGRAVELIGRLEGMDRGRYSGPVGWIDARGDGEWGIALRCGSIEGSHVRLFAGCGIMADSDPAAELAEAQSKLRVMQDALEGR
ncbi:isochorismate synthase [Spongiactinospora gelatinilytica]|uniref:isochorismate synthase n=1 Tax=Spongiactinospora gelatinilytica TaxID=2666298 RepID=A0A2W2I106_9ACTN|nr:isochorismate synthase [Spongiactinospora gelatinilytica]PZG55648.1 isochorismate synthase [Spongiactinospora gelatinilytica]